uniref:Uncharacterized protein n=1 Tax=Cacopsylla melanoneura TaxID=428564 RepID=A0A8D8PXU8_9HEMI
MNVLILLPRIPYFIIIIVYCFLYRFICLPSALHPLLCLLHYLLLNLQLLSVAYRFISLLTALLVTHTIAYQEPQETSQPPPYQVSELDTLQVLLPLRRKSRTPSPPRYLVREEEAPITVTMPIKRRNKATTIDAAASRSPSPGYVLPPSPEDEPLQITIPLKKKSKSRSPQTSE